MKKQYLVIVLCLFLFVLVGEVVGKDDGQSVSGQCTDDFQKVTACLNYATGKEPTPTKECCSAVTDIRDSDPKCLCFIIQQTHNGSQQVRSLGIQEAKLLLLPSACNLHNASITYCPKLLGLSPSSPEAAIFSNASTATPSSNTPPASTTTPTFNGSLVPRLTGLTSAILAIAIFFYVPPTGFIN